MACINSHFDIEWVSPDITICGCRFVVDNYEDELFQHYQIDFRESLARAVPKRKAEYLAGRYLSQQALKRMGFGHTQVKSGRFREPLWPEGAVGSISHCKNFAVCAIALSQHYNGIGIDVEEVVSSKTRNAIESQVISAKEAAIMAEWPLEPGVAFTLVFSLKEAFFKAAFPLVQRYFDFEAITISELISEHKEPAIEFEVIDELHPRFPPGTLMRGFFRFPEEGKVMTLVTIPNR